MKAALALTVLAVLGCAAAWQGETVRIGVYNHDGPFALLDEAGKPQARVGGAWSLLFFRVRRPVTPWTR